MVKRSLVTIALLKHSHGLNCHLESPTPKLFIYPGSSSTLETALTNADFTHHPASGRFFPATGTDSSSSNKEPYLASTYDPV